MFVSMYVCTEQNGTEKHYGYWLKISFVYMYNCIQMINTHGDTIYLFLWVEEERQFLWNWFSDKVLIFL